MTLKIVSRPYMTAATLTFLYERPEPFSETFMAFICKAVKERWGVKVEYEFNLTKRDLKFYFILPGCSMDENVARIKDIRHYLNDLIYTLQDLQDRHK